MLFCSDLELSGAYPTRTSNVLDRALKLIVIDIGVSGADGRLGAYVATHRRGLGPARLRRRLCAIPWFWVYDRGRAVRAIYDQEGLRRRGLYMFNDA